jgi:hypothetical protein
VGGTATVAAGLEYPLGGYALAVLVPGDVTFESVACATVPISLYDYDVRWSQIGPLDPELPVEWGLGTVNYLATRRVYVMIIAEVEDGLRRLYAGLSPVLAGDVYGSTPVLHFEPCNPAYSASHDCPLFENVSMPVLIDTVFEGCGGRPGSCLVSDAAGDRCREWTTSLPEQTEQFESLCTGQGGVLSPDACPEGGRVWECWWGELPDGTRVFDWYYAPMTIEDAAAACAGGRLEPAQ